MLDKETPAQEKAAVSPEERARRQAARKIGRIVWQQGYRASHPDATPQDVKEAAVAAKAEHGKLGKQVMRALENAGMTITQPAAKTD